MLTLTASQAPASRAAARASFATLVRAAFTARRERAALARLDAHLLRDIGLTDTQACRESARPLWDLPSHRL